MTIIENDSPKEFFEGPFEVSDLIPFTFPYADRTDVKVKIGDEAATYGVEYEISAESPSSILVKVNIDDGVQVTVYRETPIDQQSSYPQNSKFRSEQVESDLDKVCMIQQEQKEMLARCLRVPVENIDTFDGELPSPQEGKILIWSDGGKIVNSPSTITEIEDSVNTAVSNANTAVTTANSADSKADGAISTANTASTNASTALTNSQTALSNSQTAVQTATSASETATSASNKVDAFGKDIAAVIEAAEKIDELEEAVQTAVSAAETASDKADIASNKATEATNAANRAEAVIPTQTGQNGKFLKTNGTSTSWETVDLSSKQDVLVSGTNIKTINNNSILGDGNLTIDALPSQTGNTGKFLTTNGTDASWSELNSANINIDNLTALGNARLQYAPFAINDGYVVNGKNNTLYLPGGSQTQVETQWTQPVLSDNGVLGGDSFAVYNSGATADTWKAFDGNNATWWLGNGEFIFYNPDALKVTNVTLNNSNQSAYYGTANLGSSVLQGSNDNATWTTIATPAYLGSGITWDASSNTNFYKYYKITMWNGGAYGRSANNFTITATYMQTISSSTTIIGAPCTITTADGRTSKQDFTVVYELTDESDGNYCVFKDFNTSELSLVSNFIMSPIAPTTPTNNDYWLDVSTVPANLKIYNGANWDINNDLVYIGDVTISSGTVYKVINKVLNDNGYSDGRQTETSWAFPSNTFEAVTLGANGASYTAPANGWYSISKVPTSSGQYIAINTSANIATTVYATASNGDVWAYVPVLKGQRITVWYTTAGTTKWFKFIYAKGSESEAE